MTQRILPLLLVVGCGGGGGTTVADATSSADGATDAAATTDAPVGAAADAGTGAQPTRLRITSRCDAPIWIAHSDNVADPQNVMLAPGQSHDVAVPDSGLAAARFWPKLGCDSDGHGCRTGDTGEGGGVPCPAGGCQPPVDSKFEVTFAAVGSAASTWYNLSLVDGYTVPFLVLPKGAGAEAGSCVTSDCSALSLAACPVSEDLSGGGAFPAYADVDLRLADPVDPAQTIGCLAPCKKWNWPAPRGLGQPEGDDPGLHMCCPTPIDPASGNCTVANHCMTSEACRDPGDPVSVVHTSYVAAIHAMCPSAYSYSYDDAQGLHTCPAAAQFEVVFCP